MANVASVKTAIDVSGEALAAAMRFNGAKTKQDAVVWALGELNRGRRVDQFIREAAGSMPELPHHDEVDVEREALLKCLMEPEPFPRVVLGFRCGVGAGRSVLGFP